MSESVITLEGQAADEARPTDDPYVVWFGDASSDELGLVGGKAASLGRLVKSGFPVPPGFSVSTVAYSEFMAALNDEIAEILGTIDYTDASQVEAETARVRALIVDRPLPSHLAAAITRAYASLGGDHLEAVRSSAAVRSSGTAEDLAEASFAGLHDTYLDVFGDEAILDAVKRCWASLWTARAVAYRHDKGFTHEDAKLAVVVQQMVASEVSGVMFTANPLSVRTDEFVINASWGLGEAIVSGIVTSDEFLVRRRTREVKRKTLGPKDIRIVKNPEGVGTVKQDVPPALQETFSLSDDSVAELAELGERVMAYYHGLPQDIEWGFADGKFYLLQSRPVTGVEFTWDDEVTATIDADHDDSTVWTSAWSEDFLTGGVTPLYYSVRVGGEFQYCKDHMFRIYGFADLVGKLMFKYHRATAYFNCDLERVWNIYSQHPRLRNFDYVPHTWDEAYREAPWNKLKWARAMLRMHVLEPKTGFYHWLSDKPGGVYHWIGHRIDEANGPSAEDLQALTDDELLSQIRETRHLAEEWCLTLWAGWDFHAVTAFNLLAVLLSDWYDGTNQAAYQEVISGIPGTLLMHEGAAAAQLANEIRHSPSLLAVFERTAGADFFAECEGSEEGRTFLEHYGRFLRDHGHRGHQDRDIYYKRRHDDPSLSYAMLRTLLASEEATTPEELERRLVAARVAATEEVIENVRKKPLGGLKAEVLMRLLDYLQKFMKQRDDERHFYDRITYQTKKVWVELGRRMHERGLFKEEDDFYFLAEKELVEHLEGRSNAVLVEAKVAARKRVFHRRNRREEYTPPYLQGADVMDMKARTEVFAGAVEEEGTFRGLGTSVGRTTGTARIVPNLEDIGRVQPGEILVCHSTDPGWAPVFSIISGLILETGSLLSHGACLSREYGLPAVLLRHAMEHIEDGAAITIDGSTGEVVVHADGAPEPELEAVGVGAESAGRQRTPDVPHIEAGM